MARMLTQLPLPLCPGREGDWPGVGVVDSPDGGGVVWVNGLATSRGTRLTRRRAAGGGAAVAAEGREQTRVEAAFEVIPLTLWRRQQDLAAGGVAA